MNPRSAESVDEIVDAVSMNRTHVSYGGQLVTRKQATVDSLKTQAEVVLRALAEQLAKAARFGGVEPPIGTVLRWHRSFEKDGMTGVVKLSPSGDEMTFTSAPLAPTYTYLAFRAESGDWFTTSQRGANKVEWEQLLKDIGDSPCEIVSGWTEVPAPEKVSNEKVDPTEWAKQMFAPKVDGSVDKD